MRSNCRYTRADTRWTCPRGRCCVSPLPGRATFQPVGGSNKASTCCRVMPLTRTVFRRAAWPDTSSIADFGTPSDFASNFSTEVFAAPLSGMARTRIFRWARPSAAVSMPSVMSRDAFGITRRRRDTPSPSSLIQSATNGLRPDPAWVPSHRA